MAQMPAVLRLGLILGIVAAGVYGLLFLLVPAQSVAFMGGAPFHVGWIRWSGGILLGIAYGLFRVLNAPAKQGTFVLSIALGALLAGLAILFSWVMGEMDAYLVWIVLPIVVDIVIAILLFLGWQAGRSVLQ